MHLRYRTTFTLANEHSDVISAIVFSPDGLFLASSSYDGRIIVWSLLTGEACHRIIAKSGISCLAWPSCANSIVAGAVDGSLMMLTVDETLITASGCLAHHDGCIQSLSLSCNKTDSADSNATACTDHMLASAASNAVIIWDWDQHSKFWQHFCTLDQPPFNPFGGTTFPAEVTNVEWLSPPQDNCLAVSYLHHGIICWQLDQDTFSQIWAIQMPLCGSFNISADNDLLAVSNILTGFDIYEIRSGLHKLALQVNGEHPDQILPIKFHYGKLLLASSMVGKLYLHNSQNAKCLQRLRLKDKVAVQAISTFHSEESDVYMIAGGTSISNSANYIQVWKAVQQE
ncbi:WD40 repeat-like protein [Laetiporus sulphureus 93-53]|uniref:WD40 repeat-like protein n=1 Tax=Laetiporus sulphureus 93-53 TaxID=1314785 RepID=A0A165AW05_9APHY|nr:WD40 repeat-like protein [Laetiporus sulphureus 93-53]KZS99768.1 WD40 repeat-like protein [Laetiporus sulphureus 93-53]